jgi:hypothetical protein
MLQPFPSGDPEITSTNWQGWFTKLRTWINFRTNLEARNSSGLTLTTGASPVDAALDLIQINIGAPFIGGIFTAPETGIYHLSYTINCNSSTLGQETSISVDIFKNNTALYPSLFLLYQTLPITASVNWTTLSTSGCLQLNKGDEIKLKLYNISIPGRSVDFINVALSLQFIQ